MNASRAYAETCEQRNLYWKEKDLKLMHYYILQLSEYNNL